MHRSHFRSQPTLQRSGSRSSFWPWVVGAAVIVIAAVIGFQLARVAPAPPPAPSGVAFSPASAPPIAMSDAPAVVAPPAPGPPAPPPAIAAKPPQTQTARRSAPLRKTPPAVEVAPAPPAPKAPTYEERRAAYQLAVARYDRAERLAGYQWAKQNDVDHSRYCRDESRTPAFMAGCLDFLHKAPPNMGDAAQDASGREPD
jgi:hypothetical protein